MEDMGNYTMYVAWKEKIMWDGEIWTWQQTRVTKKW
jgi:hypothetical protein